MAGVVDDIVVIAAANATVVGMVTYIMAYEI